MKLPKNEIFCMFFFAVLAAGCSRSSEYLGSVPPTFAGTLEVKPKGRETGDLYKALIVLGNKYGLQAYGDGASNGVNWQIQVYCRKHYTAGAVTTEAGDLVLFNASAYGFKRLEDYEGYKSELVRLMGKFGSVGELRVTKPLSRADLVAREKYMKLDLTSQCSEQR